MAKTQATTFAPDLKEEMERVTEFLEELESQKPLLAHIQKQTTKEFTDGFLKSNPAYEKVQEALTIVETHEDQVMLHLHHIHKIRTLGKTIIDSGHFGDFAIKYKLGHLNAKWAKLVSNVVLSKKTLRDRLAEMKSSLNPEQQHPESMMIEKSQSVQKTIIKRIRIVKRDPNFERVRVYGVFDDYDKWGMMRINDSQIMKRRVERIMARNVLFASSFQ